MSVCPFCKKDSKDYVSPVRCQYKYIKGEDKGRICNRIIKRKIGNNIDRPLCGQHLAEILKSNNFCTNSQELLQNKKTSSRSAAEEGSQFNLHIKDCKE